MYTLFNKKKLTYDEQIKEMGIPPPQIAPQGFVSLHTIADNGYTRLQIMVNIFRSTIMIMMMKYANRIRKSIFLVKNL